MLITEAPVTPSNCHQSRSAWAKPAVKGGEAARAGCSWQGQPLSCYAPQLVDHSSDKSSQDRHSFLEVEEQEGVVASAGASSRLNLVPSALDGSFTDCALEQAFRTPSSFQTTTRATAKRARAPLDAGTEDVSVDSTLLGASAVAGSDWQLDSPESPSASTHHIKLGSYRFQGCTPTEQAASARKLCASALQNARIKAKRAAHMIAIAQRMAMEAARASKRRKTSHVHCHKSTNILVGARISVYWSDDDTYYKGSIVDVNDDEDLHKIVYDDEVVEWLSLYDERFQLLTPRAASAGCTTSFLRELEALGVDGTVDSKRCAPAYSSGRTWQPSNEEAVGWRLAVHSRADGQQHECQVLAFDAARMRHHVLYLDGEDEWLSLADERVECRSSGRCLPISAGLHQDQDLPAGYGAVGWRIAIYWKTDMAFYSGVVQDFDSATGRHHVSYSDGDEEYLMLANERIKWVLPPELGVAHPPTPAKQPPPPLDNHTAARIYSQLGKHGKVWWAEDSQRSAPPAGEATRWGSKAARRSRASWGLDAASKPGSIESISQMLERIDADECALMGHTEAIKPAEPFYVTSHQEVFDGGSPHAGSMEGHGSHTVGASPQGSASLSPVQSGHLLPLEPFLGQKHPRACSSLAKPFVLSTEPTDSALPDGMLRSSSARLLPAAKSEPELQRWEALGSNYGSFASGPMDRSSNSLLGGELTRSSGMPMSPSPVPVLNRFLSVPCLAPFGGGDDGTCADLGADASAEGLDLLDMLMVDAPLPDLPSAW